MTLPCRSGCPSRSRRCHRHPAGVGGYTWPSCCPRSFGHARLLRGYPVPGWASDRSPVHPVYGVRIDDRGAVADRRSRQVTAGAFFPGTRVTTGDHRLATIGGVRCAEPRPVGSGSLTGKGRVMGTGCLSAVTPASSFAAARRGHSIRGRCPEIPR